MTPADFARRMAAGPAGIAKALAAAGTRAAAAGERAARDRARTALSVRTGNLRRSILGTATVEPSGALAVSLRAGGGAKAVKYARIQELGGTVTPKRGRYLRIPLKAAKTAAGVDRYAGPLRQALPGLFVIRAKSGKLFLVRPKGRGKSRGLEFLYLLVEKSTIPARPYLRPSMDDVAQSLKTNMGAALSAAIGGR